jgi:hypothetical protein
MKPGVKPVQRGMEKKQSGMERIQRRSQSTSILERAAEAATSEEKNI